MLKKDFIYKMPKKFSFPNANNYQVTTGLSHVCVFDNCFSSTKVRIFILEYSIFKMKQVSSIAFVIFFNTIVKSYVSICFSVKYTDNKVQYRICNKKHK